MIIIKEKSVWICGKKFIILGKWDTEYLQFNIVTNYYDVDKFIPNSEGKKTHGEARIHLKRDQIGVQEFFGIDTQCEFFILKKDLENYLWHMKNYFLNPSKDDVKFDNGNKDELWEEITLNIMSNFEYSINELNNLTEDISYFQMFCLDDGNRFYLRNEDRSNQFYKLLRNICVPYKSYISILKLKDNDGKIFYHMRLSFEDILTPKKFKNKLNNFQIEDRLIKQLCASLNSGHNIVLNGVPGTGKTHLATIFSEEAMSEEGYILTTATSDWTTFDTIGGLMPNKDGELVFHEGKFLQAIRENKWLIIDEINRADIDKAFGQLFTVLSGQNVELPYKIHNYPIKLVINKNLDINQYKDGVYYIGNKWRIIATMNSYDKNSLFDLSYAFMRRFMFIDIEVPNNFDFIYKLKEDEKTDFLRDLDEEYFNKLEMIFEINKNNINRKLGPAIFLDIFKYINSVSKLEGYSFDYNSKILSDAIISFIIPQFEGYKDIDEIKSFFKEYIFNEDDDVLSLVNSKLDDLKIR